MKKIIIILGVIFLSSCVNEVSAQANHIKIKAFGDSITQGLARKYDGEGNKITWGILDPPLGYPTTGWGYQIELDKLIESNLHIDKNITEPVSATVYNWGQEGWTSSDSLNCEERPKNCIDTVLASGEAQFILLLFGSNDLYQGISVSTTKFNIGQLVERSKSAEVEPIIGTITPNTDKHAPFKKSDIEQFYNPEIRQLALEKEVVLADHFNSMLALWDEIWTSGDGLHLSREGNEKMAETWYNSILNSEYFNSSLSAGPLLLLLDNN